MARKRARKTGLTGPEWKHLFGAVAKYCAKHRAPNEPMNVCVKKVWDSVRTPEGRIDIAKLRALVGVPA